MSRFAVELNKFRNLKVLILKGNRLNHFNIPKRYLTYRQFRSTYNQQANSGLNYRFNTSHNYNYKNYKDFNRYANQRRIMETKIEVFPKLLLLDLSENNIEIIAPTGLYSRFILSFYLFT